jgi:hypothetical protein
VTLLVYFVCQYGVLCISSLLNGVDTCVLVYAFGYYE